MRYSLIAALLLMGCYDPYYQQQPPPGYQQPPPGYQQPPPLLMPGLLVTQSVG